MHTHTHTTHTHKKHTLSLCLSVCLYVSLSHTHTHTHTRSLTHSLTSLSSSAPHSSATVDGRCTFCSRRLSAESALQPITRMGIWLPANVSGSISLLGRKGRPSLRAGGSQMQHTYNAFPAELGVTWYVQLHISRCVPQGERTVFFSLHYPAI